MKKLLILCALVTLSVQEKCYPAGKKNVIVIMADDLAFNDVSLRGSLEIPTPNIDALAYNGILLNRFYTPTLCSPSRASLLTGKYPQSLGMQNSVVHADEPWGLDLNEKIMPEYFKDAGYATHLIGKWHLGLCRKAYTPIKRGFDSYFGYLGPFIDFWSYEHWMENRNYSRGFDMRRDLEVASELNNTNKYTTELFTEKAVEIIKNHDKKTPLYLQINHLAPHAGNADIEMQAPQKDIERFNYIDSTSNNLINGTYRRTLAAMMYQLDLSVGEVMKALKETDLLKNSIVFFYSDNGGPTRGIHATSSSNYPLRGQKESPWEGATRNFAVLYADFLPKSVVKNEMYHVSDLLPTFSNLANAGYKIDKKIDGLDQSKILRKSFTVSKKHQVRDSVYTIGFGNRFNYTYSSIIYKDFKFVNGSNSLGRDDGYLGVNQNVDVNADKYQESVRNSETWKAIGSTVSSSTIKKFREASVVQCQFNPNTENKKCDLIKAPCLFDIINDPCEQNNLADDEEYAGKVKEFIELRDEMVKTQKPSLRIPFDMRANPINWGGIWTWWMDELESEIVR